MKRGQPSYATRRMSCTGISGANGNRRLKAFEVEVPEIDCAAGEKDLMVDVGRL
ncbi:hypothetical protein [Streptomyces sp. NBRC 110028]|uniref:hypothetical protein n=1 Tax=Streptomyces sp. NBRC 110028 TaxID=1621260 RepID=UPI00131A84EA|nr:hypothetical protein [Streptomyces sp. NBRC 110028]